MKNSVLFLTNAYPDFDSSTRGIFIRKMASLLQNEGYRISVVTPKIFRKSPCYEEQNGIHVYRFPFFAGNKLLIEYRKIPYLKMLLYYICGFFLTMYVSLKHKCSLLHVHWAIPTGLIAVVVGMFLRKPFVVTVHGSDFRMASEGSTLLKKIFLFICQRASHLNCVSEVMRKEIIRMSIDGEKVSTFPMGVDNAFFEAGKGRGRKLNGQPYIIVSNRQLYPIYNLSSLIRAIPIVLKQEPEVKFLIAGEGPERENLESEAKNSNVASVRFLGRVPNEEMPELLGRTDIYVSTSPYDGTSVSLLEAMATGAFPIVTDIPANREWIFDGENGFLVSVDKEGVLADKILGAIRDQTLLEKSRIRNLSMVGEKVLWPENIEKIRRIYEQLCQK